MHELSIAAGIMETVKKVMKEHSATRIGEITVEIGSLSGVDPSSLEFCFEAIIAGSPLEGARLRIHEMQARARCNTCGNLYPISGSDLSCSKCHSDDFEVISGTEIFVTQVEVE